jgi:hypothetical protein
MAQAHLSIEQVAGAVNTMVRERAQERLNALKKPPAQPTPQPQPSLTPREPGVYFGLSAESYHTDPSLGSSDIRRLLVSPSMYWWRSWMNPNRPPDNDTPAKLRGRAVHKLVLEGEAAFSGPGGFAEEPSPAGHPGCLVTLDDLKARARELGQPTSGTKAELSARIRAKDPKAIVFSDILETWKAMAARDNLEVLKPDMMEDVRRAAATITSNPHLLRAFSGGASEVSVFWQEDGVPLKARIDYLKKLTLVDLKGVANARERPVDVAIRLAIAEYRLDIQAAHYLSAYQHLWQAAQDGAIYGDCPLPGAWPQQIAAPPDMSFTWIFQCADAPVSKGRSLRADSPALNKATREVALAKRLYRENLNRFGTDCWVDDEPVTPLEAAHLPAWLREETEYA